MRLKKALILIILFSSWAGFCYSQIEQVSPVMTPYLNALQTRINHSSVGLNGDNYTGVVGLSLLVNSEGKLQDIKVRKSSGDAGVDNMAMSVVQGAFPFVPFPQGTKEEFVWMNVDVPVSYTKEGAPFVLGKEEIAAEEKEQVLPMPVIPSSEQKQISEKISSASPARSELILEEYIKIGLENNRSTKIAKEQQELAKLKIRERMRNLFPEVVGQYKKADGETLTDPYESKSYGLEISQLILGLDQVGDAVKRERLGSEMAKKNYQRLSNDQRYNITKAYYEAIGQKLLLGHWQETSKEIKQDLDILTRLYDAGLLTNVDYENAISQQKLIKHQIFSNESSYSLSKLALIQAMNLDVSMLDEIKVPVDFGGEPRDLNIDLEECVNIALRARPELEIWELTGKSAKLNELINIKESGPKLKVAASYGRSGESYTNQTLDMVDEWSIIGKVSWLWGGNSFEVSEIKDAVVPKNITDTATKTNSLGTDVKFSLLDRLNYYSAKKEAAVTYSQSLNELNESKKRIIYEVKEAYLAYVNSLSSMESTLKRLTYSENELKIKRARVEAGEGSPTETIEAKIELGNIRASYIRSLAEYYLAVATLDKTTGYQLHHRLIG